MLTHRNTKPSQTGLSLIELMIAMTLGLVILLGIMSLFVQNNRSYRQNDLIASMQDNARFTLQTLTRDLMMAGYWGGMFSADGIESSSTLSGIADCGPTSGTGWAFDVSSPVEFSNNVASASINSDYSCLSSSSVLDGTDIVVIRRVAGQRTAFMDASAVSATLIPNQFYLQTNLSSGTLFHNYPSNPSVPNPVESPTSPPMEFWRYLVRLYYVHPHSDEGESDNIPTLCRREFLDTESPPDMATHADADKNSAVCFGEGVEDFQILWGIDSSGNGIADTFTAAPGSAISGAINARIFLLMRSREVDGLHKDDKSYVLAGKTVAAANDGYYRRVYETTILLRNVR